MLRVMTVTVMVRVMSSKHYQFNPATGLMRPIKLMYSTSSITGTIHKIKTCCSVGHTIDATTKQDAIATIIDAVSSYRDLPAITFIIHTNIHFRENAPSYLADTVIAYAYPKDNIVVINHLHSDNIRLLIHEIAHIVADTPDHDDTFYKVLEATGRVKIGSPRGYKDYRHEELI